MTSLAFNDNQLESVSITFDSSLLQNSTPSAGLYSFDCPYSVDVNKYRVDMLCVPPTQYHVDDSNNRVVFTTAANGKMTAYIETGYYEDEAALLLAVDAALTAASDAADGTDHTYVVIATPGTNIENTGQIKITQDSATLTVHGGESSASFLLGLGSSDVASVGVDYTGPGQIRFTGSDAISVLTSTFSSNNSYVGKKSGNLITIPLNSPGQLTLFHDANPAFVDLESSQRLKNIEFRLLGSNGLPVVLQSSSPTIRMTFAVTRRPLF